MTIHRINETLYAVESESTDRSYTVNLAGNGSCSCPHHTYRGVACKHILACQNLPQPTALEKAAVKAAGLTDEQLKMWQAQYQSGPVSCACLLELASRKLQAEAARPQPKPIPAGVEVLLQGATEAERERALACYR